MGRSGCIRPLASNAKQGRNTASDEFRRLYFSQLHGLANAWAELLLLARIIRMVEKQEFAHARARVRYPLDKVLRESGNSAFRNVSAQRGGAEMRLLATGCYLQWKPALAAT
jgi:hypothetical protein